MFSPLMKSVAILLIVAMLASCAMDAVGPGKATSNLESFTASRLIDHFYDDVRSTLLENNGITQEQYEKIGNLNGEEITRSVLTESNGKEYLDFLNCSKAGDSIESADEVIDRAESLISDKAKVTELREKAKEIESRVYKEAEVVFRTRALNASQKEAFNKELRALVVKSVVLLVAAVVYAFIPSTVLWGKVVAGTAIAVAAGVLATTLGVIIDYKNGDIGKDKALKEWLDEISKEPIAASAIAAGITNTASAMGASPVVSALVLIVFAIWNIKDDVKPLLDAYNLKT